MKTGLDRKPHPALPPDLVKNIGILARDGYAANLIGEILGVSDKTVRRHAALHGIVLPKRSKPELCAYADCTPHEKKLEAAARRRRYIDWNGERVALIDAAARLNLTPEALAVRIKRWGLDRAMKLPRIEHAVRYRNR